MLASPTGAANASNFESVVKPTAVAVSGDHTNVTEPGVDADAIPTFVG